MNRTSRLALAPLCFALLYGCGNNSDDEAVAAATPTASRSATASPTASVTPTVVNPATACRALSGMMIGTAHLGSTTLVAANPPSPQYCKVTAKIDPALNFELRLPTNWNQKLVFLGGGGYDGIIGSPDDGGRSTGILAKGFASVATDSGHRGNQLDGSWALNDAEAVDNFAVQSTHRVLLATREILTARYGAMPRRAYFEGGSEGGREALIEAQRFPDDFDGVIAREPAFNFTALQLAHNRIVQQMFVTPGGYLDADAVRLVGDAVTQACDALDGLADGIVSHLAACHVDPQSLRCNAAETSGCLTDAQIATVNLIHADGDFGIDLANGLNTYRGWPLGLEDSSGAWPLWLTGSSPETPSSFGFTLQEQFLLYFVTKDPHFDTLHFDPTAYRAPLQALSALMDATDPDLAAFRARGGKLILWHGLSDYGISAYNTIDYYQRTVTAAGGQAAADQFLRLYLSPGVDHTGGGVGAAANDFLTPIDAWVEGGAAPADLVGYRPDPNTNQLLPFRPLCRWPAYVRYNGSGDVNSPDSFSCALP